MDAFNKCPQCGELDVRRTRCVCGYGTGAATPPAAPPNKVEENVAGASPPSAPEESDGTKERCLGAFMLFVGAVMTYLCIYQPLAAASRDEEKITLSLKGAILCPLAVGLGVFYLVLGKQAAEIAGTREKPSPVAYAIGIALALVGVGLYFYLNSVLTGKGYH